MLVLDASGKDLLFLETVGAGQSEVEVIGIADTILLVLMPGSGDSVQALKAGIMEIPDVIAINKSDHPAAKTMLNEVRSILSLDRGRAWKPPIVLTEALRGENVDDALGQDPRAPRVPRGRERPRGAPAQESRRRGFRRRVVSREDSSPERGRGRSRVAPPARRGAAPRARPAHRGPRDHREGLSNWRHKRLRRSLTSRRRAGASPRSRASLRSTAPRRCRGSPGARCGSRPRTSSGPARSRCAGRSTGSRRFRPASERQASSRRARGTTARRSPGPLAKRAFTRGSTCRSTHRPRRSRHATTTAPRSRGSENGSRTHSPLRRTTRSTQAPRSFIRSRIRG